jgi:hypothetical protein
LKAKLKSGSSYTWQSALAGLECFKQGYIWRVGDGTQIKIYGRITEHQEAIILRSK